MGTGFRYKPAYIENSIVFGHFYFLYILSVLLLLKTKIKLALLIIFLFWDNLILQDAGVAKLVDAADSKSAARKGVSVQLRSPVLQFTVN